MVINILIPLAGNWPSFENERYPGPVEEISGKPMIERVIDNLDQIGEDHRFVFILQKKDCSDYYLDNIVRLLTDDNCEVVIVDSPTKGSAASALLAVKHINTSDGLIISNGDQLFDIDLNTVVDFFDRNDAHGGIVTFESVHPRWSYALIDDQGRVVEVTAKRPISKNAVAGFYYYREGCDFVDAAKEMIRKDGSEGGVFYVSPTMNELILKQKTVLNYTISNAHYHTFYSPKKIDEYIRKRNVNEQSIVAEDD